MIWIGGSATLFLACGCFIGFEVSQFNKDLTREIKVISSFIADKSSPAIMFNDPAIAEDALLSAAATEPAIVSAVIYDAKSPIFKFKGYHRSTDISHFTENRVHKICARSIHLYHAV